MMKFAPDWRSLTPPGPHVARQVAAMFLHASGGNVRDAKLRACSMWYPDEFIADVQRSVEEGANDE